MTETQIVPIDTEVHADAPPVAASPFFDRTGLTYPPELITRAEIEAILAQFSTRAPTGIRNHALIVMLWRTGIRHAEALALRPRDINPDEGTVRVLRGKGQKPRTVGLDSVAKSAVGLWRFARDRKQPPNAPLFCTLRGGAMSQNYVRDMLQTKAERAGIEKRVHPHALRHAMARELLEEGHSLKVIQLTLGHASIATTDTYLQTLSGGVATAAIRDRV